MADQNFLLGENWGGSEVVTGREKKSFLPFFDPTWVHILAQKT